MSKWEEIYIDVSGSAWGYVLGCKGMQLSLERAVTGFLAENANAKAYAFSTEVRPWWAKDEIVNGGTLYDHIPKRPRTLVVTDFVPEYEQWCNAHGFSCVNVMSIDEFINRFNITGERHRAVTRMRDTVRTLHQTVRFGPPPGLPPHLTLKAEQFQTEDVTSVRIKLMDGAGEYEFEANAKRDPRDTNDPETGLLLAYGRALRKAGNFYVQQGNQRVVAADRVKRQEEAKKAQVRAEQRKVERKVRAEKRAADEVVALRARIEDLERANRGMFQLNDEIRAQRDELLAAEAARKQRVIKQRVTTRKANAAKAARVAQSAKKTVKGKAQAKARR